MGLSEPVAFTDGNATQAASRFAMIACYFYGILVVRAGCVHRRQCDPSSQPVCDGCLLLCSLLFLWEPCCQSQLRSPTAMRPKQPASLRWLFTIVLPCYFCGILVARARCVHRRQCNPNCQPVWMAARQWSAI